MTKRSLTENIIIRVLAVMSLAALAGFVLSMRTSGGNSVSKVRGGLRSIATALEAYYIDHKAYPAMRPMSEMTRDAEWLAKMGGTKLMTWEPGRTEGPVAGLLAPDAYLTKPLDDPMTARRGWRCTDEPTGPFAYWRTPSNEYGEAGWLLWSPGPDGDYDIVNPSEVYDPDKPVPSDALVDKTYDPTNGTKSSGDVRFVKG